MNKLFTNKEKKIFNVTVRPYIMYSIINLLFIIMAKYNIGNLNSDTQCGLITSWFIYSVVLLFTTGCCDTKND